MHPISRRNARQTGARPRVLLIAHLANPDWSSVPRVGWASWRALTRVADVHAVTHVRNRENIIRAGVTESEFTAFATPRTDAAAERVFRLIHRGTMSQLGMGFSTMSALGVLPYYEFERQVWHAFGDRIRGGEFDIVHRLTPLSPTVPSLIAARCARAGVPFVLGPLNGGLPWPSGFGYARREEHEWLTYVREGYKLLPGYRATRRHAAAIICGSMATREQISARHRHKTVYIPENAIDPRRFPIADGASDDGPLRVVFVGRLTRYKGCDMLLQAAAPLARAGTVELTLIGDGPQENELRGLVQAEGLPPSVLAGYVEHAELKERLRRAHVFAFPSVREFGGAVVLESMAMGIMPVVIDYGGPGELVSDDTGVRLPLGTRDEIVRRLRATLARLASDRSDLHRKARLGSARVARWFTWEAKAAQILEVYRWVSGERSKPDFGMPFPDHPHAITA